MTKTAKRKRSTDKAAASSPAAGSKSEYTGERAFTVYRIPPPDAMNALPPPEEVGAKAHNLMRLQRAGLTVPPGFVVSTRLCTSYMEHGEAAFQGLAAALKDELQALATSRNSEAFGDPSHPLLVSVRSGAAVSMPGMMDTVLNIGMTSTAVRGLTRRTGNPRLAPDCLRRLIAQYGEVVDGLKPHLFERATEALLKEAALTDVGQLDTSQLHRLAEEFGQTYERAAGKPFPNQPEIQLINAVKAVVRSWQSERAMTYRKLQSIPDDLGTAVLVQAMVFGNAGLSSGSGVGFTRSPVDGTPGLYADYAANAQGEDVVSGRARAYSLSDLERRAPSTYADLMSASQRLELEFADMQDFEFTVENNQLFVLQSRTGKRTPLSALRIACDLVDEGRITPQQALDRLSSVDLDKLAAIARIGDGAPEPVAKGVPASPGIAVGVAVFDPGRIDAYMKKGPVILLRPTADTDEVAALAKVAALVSASGARTAHAAVVARQLGRTCIVGCQAVAFAGDGISGSLNGQTINEGDTLSVNGASGDIYLGAVEVIEERPTELLAKVAEWEKAARRSRT